MRTACSFVLSAAAILAAAIDAPAKILSLDDRCRCTREWADHAEYVRCVKHNAKRYLRFEARFDPNGRRKLTRRELRAAARTRVAEPVAPRCGMPEYLCDADRPCAPGETCDVRDCEATVGVCVPTPESCPTDGTLRCTCGTETDPLGRAYANDCERLRAGAKLNTFGNPPYTKCRPSCGGAEARRRGGARVSRGPRLPASRPDVRDVRRARGLRPGTGPRRELRLRLRRDDVPHP